MPLTLDPLRWAEAGEFELLQGEEHPREAVDHLRVAARVFDEHLGVRPDCRSEALRLLEALCPIISFRFWRREHERSDGYVVGQGVSPPSDVREGLSSVPYGTGWNSKRHTDFAQRPRKIALTGSPDPRRCSGGTSRCARLDI
jgi:hypothetical protein